MLGSCRSGQDRLSGEFTTGSEVEENLGRQAEGELFKQRQ